ncbi:hypothetical protein ACET3Z_016467 [Daucus carota]
MYTDMCISGTDKTFPRSSIAVPDFPMEEGSGNSGPLIGDEDSDPVVDIEQVFGIDSVDLENDSGMLGIDCQEFENESQQVLGVQGDDFGDGNQHPLEFDGRELEGSDQVFEFENNDRGNDSDQMIEIANSEHLNGLNEDCGSSRIKSSKKNVQMHHSRIWYCGCGTEWATSFRTMRNLEVGHGVGSSGCRVEGD